MSETDNSPSLSRPSNLTGNEPELSGARRPAPRIVERHHRAFAQITDPLTGALYFDCPDCGMRFALLQMSASFHILFRDLVHGTACFITERDMPDRLFYLIRDIALSSECPNWNRDSSALRLIL